MDFPDSGRITDPKVAPFIPVDIFLHAERPELDPIDTGFGVLRYVLGEPTWTVRISTWSRGEDEVMEFAFTFKPTEDNPVTMRRRPLDAEDREWLKNIGAYGKDTT